METDFRIIRSCDTVFGKRRRNLGCSNASGFTLVETIVASVILFTCLSAATMSYHTSVDLISRSESSVRITSALREIRATVRDKLVSGRLEGKDEYEAGITFSWKAVLSRESRNITQAVDEITGGLEYGQFRMSLYEVTLIIACYQFGRERVSDYGYQELTWSAL